MDTPDIDSLYGELRATEDELRRITDDPYSTNDEIRDAERRVDLAEAAISGDYRFIRWA